MSTQPPISRHSLFSFLQTHPSFTNLGSAMARLPPPSPHPAEGWAAVRVDALHASSISKPSHLRVSPALMEIQPNKALPVLEKMLKLKSISIGDSLQYHAQEQRLSLFPAGALAWAVAAQFLPNEFVDCAPVLRSILADTPLPSHASSEQIGNALLLLHLGANGPQSVFSLFGISPAGYQWLATRTTIPPADIQANLQRLQVNYAKALYHGAEANFI